MSLPGAPGAPHGTSSAQPPSTASVSQRPIGQQHAHVVFHGQRIIVRSHHGAAQRNVAAGDAALTNSSAGRMFGVSAGGAAAVNGGTAGEDILILAGNKHAIDHWLDTL